MVEVVGNYLKFYVDQLLSCFVEEIFFMVVIFFFRLVMEIFLNVVILGFLVFKFFQDEFCLLDINDQF